jgi:hypothetical protein
MRFRQYIALHMYLLPEDISSDVGSKIKREVVGSVGDLRDEIGLGKDNIRPPLSGVIEKQDLPRKEVAVNDLNIELSVRMGLLIELHRSLTGRIDPDSDRSRSSIARTRTASARRKEDGTEGEDRYEASLCL